VEARQPEGEDPRGRTGERAEPGEKPESGATEPQPPEGSGYTEEEEAEITKRLEDLGYL